MCERIWESSGRPMWDIGSLKRRQIIGKLNCVHLPEESVGFLYVLSFTMYELFRSVLICWWWVLTQWNCIRELLRPTLQVMTQIWWVSLYSAPPTPSSLLSTWYADCVCMLYCTTHSSCQLFYMQVLHPPPMMLQCTLGWDRRIGACLEQEWNLVPRLE